jgi:hypothetical protein
LPDGNWKKREFAEEEDDEGVEEEEQDELLARE